MKRIIAFLISLILLFPATAYAVTDDFIRRDAVLNTYGGRQEALEMIENLKFTDIPPGHPAQEAIVRTGALNLVKGYTGLYKPDNAVSNQEAIAFMLRAIGLENTAVALGATLQAQAPQNETLRGLWSLGYLNLANQRGMITPAEYAEAIADQNAVVNFDRSGGAIRERVAHWVVQVLESVDANAFAGTATATMQKVLTFKDFEQIDPNYVLDVEKLTLNGIMQGNDKGNFDPKGYVTRAEMAKILAAMDDVYYKTANYSKLTGTVGAIQDEQYTSTGKANVTRKIYVRTADGTVDLLQLEIRTDNLKGVVRDAVVLKNNQIAGMGVLQEGDEIEYIVNNATKEVLYIRVTKQLTKGVVQGYVQSINVVNNAIVIKDSTGKDYSYNLARGIITTEDGVSYIIMDKKRQSIERFPLGSIVKLTLVNNIVTELSYVGQPTVYNEVRGIVTENNPGMGYLSIIDNSGKEVVKYYYESQLKVEKQQYYDIEDEIGYIDDVFPHFEYDPRDTIIDSIEPGDIVFLRLSDENPAYITSISAATDYVMKYGKIKQIADNGEYLSILVEYENKQTGWYDIAGDIFASKDGKPIALSDIMIGDWAKLLVNQAIIGPGYIMESAKEIVIEGDEHFISTIVKGNLSSLNAVQNQLIIKDSYSLAKTGWSGYKNLSTYSLAGKDIEYYHNDKRVSLDYAIKYFKRSDAAVYVALENNYSGEKVKKVTFRTGRDEVLEADYILSSTLTGAFNMLSNISDIYADSGTIVRRYGRLVDAQDIFGNEYVHVVLNGEGKAAIVDIIDAPSTERIMLTRGRILSVEEGKSFKVQAMSVLNGMEWVYTPVQREFSIDHTTIFLSGAGGATNFEGFMDYTTDSVVDKVYNIVTDGSKATYVVDSPYSAMGIKGTIYAVHGNFVSLKDAKYYDNKTAKWISVSNSNATLSATLQLNTIIAKGNQVILPSGLTIGDQVTILTNQLPNPVRPGTDVNGYVVIVEK